MMVGLRAQCAEARSGESDDRDTLSKSEISESNTE
jgi:hypothetical protein